MSIKTCLLLGVALPVLMTLQACATADPAADDANVRSYEAPVTRTGSNIARRSPEERARVVELTPEAAQAMRDDAARAQTSITPISNR